MEGVTIKMKCKEHHRRVWTSTYYPDVATCHEGKWDNNILPCEPVCGILPKARELVIGGESTSIDIHPWHVGLYRRKAGNVWKHICGGTIINTATVVSAAHCVTDPQTSDIYPAGEYLIAAGKNYRDLDDSRDKDTIQKREVSKRFLGISYEFK